MEVVIFLVMLVIGLIIGFFVVCYVFIKEGVVKVNVVVEKVMKELLV